MSPSIYQQDDSGETFFYFRSSEKEKYNQFTSNKIETEEYIDYEKIRRLLESRGIEANCGFSAYEDHVRYYGDDGDGILRYSEIPECIFQEETYYLTGNCRGHLEPTPEYKTWVYENDLEVVYVKDARKFFPKETILHFIPDDFIIANNY